MTSLLGSEKKRGNMVQDHGETAHSVKKKGELCPLGSLPQGRGGVNQFLSKKKQQRPEWEIGERA